ncbi:TorF family putative porin [Sphingomonas quercus]|uniref:TorF family putative porin n=1 Tax=Sphingomonas quercus TaxID=2842451 RepID=UPI00343ABA96
MNPPPANGSISMPAPIRRANMPPPKANARQRRSAASRRNRAAPALAGMMLAAAAPGWAAPDLSFAAGIATDERRSGLSWSGGRAAASTMVGLGLGDLRLDARAVAARNSVRHGGADAVVDVSGGYGRSFGGLRVDGWVTGHVFAGGREALDYMEIGAQGGWLIGPAQLDLTASYAPDQAAIGGDNLRLGARAGVAVIGTPFALSAAAGHSSGDTDDPRRAARLRPAGGYWDWRIGGSWTRGPISVALDYVGTDIRRRRAIASPFADPGHAGDAVVARLGLSF